MWWDVQIIFYYSKLKQERYGFETETTVLAHQLIVMKIYFNVFAIAMEHVSLKEIAHAHSLHLRGKINGYCHRCRISLSLSLGIFHFFFLSRNIFSPLSCNQFAAVCLWCDVMWFYWFLHFSGHFVNKWFITISFIDSSAFCDDHLLIEMKNEKRIETNPMVCAIFSLRHCGIQIMNRFCFE